MLRKSFRFAAGLVAYGALIASLTGCTPPPPPPRAAFANQHRPSDGEDEYDSWLWKRITGKNKKQAEENHAPAAQTNGPADGPPSGVNTAGNQPPAGWGGVPNQAGNMQPGVNPYQANPPQIYPNLPPPQPGYQPGVVYGQPNYAPDRSSVPPNSTLPPGTAPGVGPSQPYPPAGYNLPYPQNLPPRNYYPTAASGQDPAQNPNAVNSGYMPANGYINTPLPPNAGPPQPMPGGPPPNRPPST